VLNPKQHTMAFDAAFRALEASHRPALRWQARLFARFAQGDVPPVCRLPTGLGKSSVIPIWLIALCGACGASLPRRLVYIVNRRTVVDQATEDAKRLLARLYRSGQRDGVAWATQESIKRLGLDTEPPIRDDHVAALKQLRLALDALGTGDQAKSGQTPPLAVSTLRGELADNGEWKKSPARPAIIIGTIDMIGSKLLFSGYGDGRYGRAHHAGLIGQDSLIIHDEAHLSPAFDSLLRSIAAEQARCGEPRPIRVLSLSATTRTSSNAGNGNLEASAPLEIENEDRRDDVVSRRLGASKSLRMVNAHKGTIVPTIVEEALRLGASPARVLVYVRSPDDVAAIAQAIEGELGAGDSTRVARLTGTIRGKERDELVESEVFRAFQTNADRSSPLPHSLYLISTSAGEVGADLDADHLVCDLSTLDSMAQRLGRVNRLGGDSRSARVLVVQDEIMERDPLAAQRRKTAEVLQELPVVERTQGSLREYDASPAALSALLAKPEAQTAFSPAPKILPATDILFDHWALTSIVAGLPGRPEVAAYLHGVADWLPPETHVVWRADIAELAKAGGKDVDGQDRPCSLEELAEVFEAFPLHSAERLRDRTDRVQAELRKIAARLSMHAPHRAGVASTETVDIQQLSEKGDWADDEGRDAQDRPTDPNPWVVLTSGGSWEWVRLGDIAPTEADGAKRAQRRIAFATVVLPVEVGGLRHGMLDGDSPAPEDVRTLDVAEVNSIGRPDRQRVYVGHSVGGEIGEPILGGETMVNAIARHSVTLGHSQHENALPRVIEYRVARGEAREPGVRVGLDAHQGAVGETAARLAMALGLRDHLATAVELAGRYHDSGKGAGREVWQRYALNCPHRDSPGGELAKSDQYGHWRMLGGYRHEFGSLLDAAVGPVGGPAPVEIADHPERDLILHLIAAHHGWARPHFEPRHFDPGSRVHPRSTAANERAAAEAIKRFARLQRRFGRWGLAWLESLVRCADAEASATTTREGGVS
jgi:CRISPR-associated endonuclease/helicase Cas3